MFPTSPPPSSSMDTAHARQYNRQHPLAPRLETPSLTSSARSSTSSMLASSGSASVHDSGLGSTNTGTGSRDGRDRSGASPPLIDLELDEGTPAPRRPLALEAGAGVSPTDKLRALLRLMDDEVRAARPDQTPKHTQPPPQHVTAVPVPVRPEVDADDTESLGPPSPPPRINNYLYSRRAAEARAPGWGDAPPSPPSPPPQPRRLPSRAIALRAAAAAAAAAESNPEPRRERKTSPPTPLESFIAHSTLRVEPSTSRLDDPTPQHDDRDPVPQDTPWHAEPSWRAEPTWLAELSRTEMLARSEAEPLHDSYDTPRRRRELSLSREPTPRREVASARATTSPGDTATPRREPPVLSRPSTSPGAEPLHRSTSPTFSSQQRARSPRQPRAPSPLSPPRSPPQRLPTLRRSIERLQREEQSARLRPGTTPRRRTVDLAPDTSASFAAGLDERQEVIVDIEDDTEVPWADDETVESSDASVPIDLRRGPTARFMVAEELSLSRSRESIGSSPRSPSGSRTFATATEGSGGESTPRAQAPMAVDTSLPELPDPDSTDDEEETAAMARRREMFRPSKTPDSSRSYSRSHSHSRPLSNTSTVRDHGAIADTRSTVLRESGRASASLRRSRPPAVRRDWSEQFEDAEAGADLSARDRFDSAGAEEDEVEFGELASLPQSSPPRVSPRKWRLPAAEWRDETASSTPGPAPAAFEDLDLGHTDDEADDDDDAYPAQGHSRDSTHDSWRELEAAAALNPPSPVSPRRTSTSAGPASPSTSVALESPALADSDTLPDTPIAPARRAPSTSTSPRSLGSASFREARSFLRNSSAVPAEPEPTPRPAPAPTPLRSALRKTKTPRFPDSPSVRWSPEVLEALDESAEAEQQDGEHEVAEEEVPAPAPPVTPVRNPALRVAPGTTSPASSPPRHLTTPRAGEAPVQATPKPPGAWQSPARDTLVATRDAPPPPVSATPRAPSPGRADVPPIAGLPPQTPLPPPPSANGVAPGAPTPGMPTPRPPGAWCSPARAPPSTVPPRTSRLRHEVRLDESASSAASSESSVHKLRLSRRSPRRTPPAPASSDTAAPSTPQREPVSPASSSPPFVTPTKSPGRLLFPQASPAGVADGEALDPDTSWTARIKDLVGSPLRPPRAVAGSELAEARFALDAASRASAQARSRVVAAQDAWRAALAAYASAPARSPSPGAAAVARTASWTVWLGWIALELVLLWGVFRVTIEYATSAAYLSQVDPFGPFAPSYAVGVRLPAGLAAFGKTQQHTRPTGASANLFDILDALGIGPAQHRWRPPT